ncbi:MAG: hypothetical protein K0U98_10245 [Deltaproteobacteria bacterium]|nr:hypothetical protein [Deltaproteobacteria bacterium]
MIRSKRLHLSALLLGATSLMLLSELPAAAQYADSFGKNKVQYRDFEWMIYHSPHFDIYYYESETHLLEKIVSYAESAYDELSRAFDFQIQEATPLIIYETHSAFEQNNIILNFIPEGVGAFATPVRNRMVLPADLPDAELLALVTHELTHIFEYHILFQGSLAKGLASNPPQWLMEGLASYMAKDESTSDRMYLRDAVVNDLIPSITQSGVGGFFAYRFGHAAFDYMEERWGKEGLLDFLYEFRNTLGSRPDRAILRALKIEGEDFDRDFRKWLREKYLPHLVETGEPADFGKPFRVQGVPNAQETSAVPSPSGDLVAAFVVYKGDLDIGLFNSKDRRLIRNLTKGLATDYQYFSSQFLTAGRRMGRDMAFSPDGNQLAVFAKRERGRSLILLDVLRGGVNRIIDMEVEQPLSPTWSSDGRTIAFSGNQKGNFDIFTIDLETLEVTNLTNDSIFDGSPAYSPDGQWLIYSSVIGERAKLFRLRVEDPSKRYQLTTGDSNDIDATFDPDGQRIFFTSDRTGVDNIFSLHLETGEVAQFTDVTTGCFMPAVLSAAGEKKRLVYNGYWKGSFRLYIQELEEPVAEPEIQEISSEPVEMASLPVFEPDIQVAVDDANKEEYGGFRFFLEGAETFFGVDDQQTLLGQVVLAWSDYLGDRRIVGIFSSQSSLSNFDIRYADLQDRWQWQVRAYDTRYFYTAQSLIDGQLIRQEEAFQQTGLQGSLIYPFGLKTRVEFGLGYVFREFAQPFFLPDSTGAQVQGGLRNVKDDFPVASVSLVGDGSIFASYGPISGRRWRLDASYAPDFDESGTKTSGLTLDARQYIPVTRRSNLALRVFGGVFEGNEAGFFSFGGLDTLRGFDYRSLGGDRVFFTNIEYRFPLIDLLAFPIYRFQGVRGRIFLDVGGGWFADSQDFTFFESDDGVLGDSSDGVAAYGFGFSFRLFGLNLNWDFAKQYDFDASSDGYRTDFYIGSRF